MRIDVANGGVQTTMWGYLIDGVDKYYRYAIEDGIGLPPGKLKIVARYTNDDDASSSTPLFSYMPSPTGWRDFLAGIFYSVYPENEMPDMVISVKNTDTLNRNKICADLFHEMGHTSHAAKVGMGWYSTLVWQELGNGIFNKPYGNRGNPNSGYIALAESWADFIELRFIHKIDPKIGYNEEDVRLNDSDRWIPYGIFYDMMDTNSDTTPFHGYFDNVSGYTPSQLYNTLNSNQASPTDYMENLFISYGRSQEAEVRRLFAGYEWADIPEENPPVTNNDNSPVVNITYIITVENFRCYYDCNSTASQKMLNYLNSIYSRNDIQTIESAMTSFNYMNTPYYATMTEESIYFKRKEPGWNDIFLGHTTADIVLREAESMNYVASFSVFYPFI